MTSILEVLTAQPKTKRELAFTIGWTTREVELEIQRYRLEGFPIVSNGDGYWLATTPAEVKKCADRLRSRAIHQMETAQALDRAVERMEQKTTLWDAA